MPSDLMERYARGEDLNTILRNHAQQEEQRKQRQKQQMDELREQQEKYKDFTQKQSVGTSRPL